MNADPELRKALRARDGNQCRYCGVEVDWRDRKSPTAGTYDHVTPLSQGGDESLANLVVSCRKCNERKGPRTPEQAGMELLTQPESRRNHDGTQKTRALSRPNEPPKPPAVYEPPDVPDALPHQQQAERARAARFQNIRAVP